MGDPKQATKQDEEAQTARDSMVALEALLDIRNRRDPLPSKRSFSSEGDKCADHQLENPSVISVGKDAGLAIQVGESSVPADHQGNKRRSGSVAAVITSGGPSLTPQATSGRTAKKTACTVSPVPPVSSASQALPLATGIRPSVTASSLTASAKISSGGPMNPSNVQPSPVLLGLTAHQALAATPAAPRLMPSSATPNKSGPDAPTDRAALQPRPQQGGLIANPSIPSTSTTTSAQAQTQHQQKPAIHQFVHHAATTTGVAAPGPQGFLSAGGAVSIVTPAGQSFVFGGPPPLLPPHQLLMATGGAPHAPNTTVFLAGTATPPAALTAVLTPPQQIPQQPQGHKPPRQPSPAQQYQSPAALSNQNQLKLRNQQPTPHHQITTNPGAVGQQPTQTPLPMMPYPPKNEVAPAVDGGGPPKLGVAASAAPASMGEQLPQVGSVPSGTSANARFMGGLSEQLQKQHQPHSPAEMPSKFGGTVRLQQGGDPTASPAGTIRAAEVQAALRSKPQRGRKRENLSAVERLELTRTRNREHAKSTRVRKKARYEELLQSEATLESIRRRDDLANRRRHVVVNLLAMRSAVMRRIVQDGGEVIEASVESILFGGNFRTSFSALVKESGTSSTQPNLNPVAALSSGPSASTAVVQGPDVTTEETTSSDEIGGLSTRSVSFQDAEVRASMSPRTELACIAGDNATSGVELPFEVANPGSILDILEDSATFRFVRLSRLDGSIHEDAQSGDSAYQGLRDMVKFDADMVGTARSRTGPNQRLQSVKYSVVNATEGVALTVKDVGYAEYDAEAESVCNGAGNGLAHEQDASFSERLSHEGGGSATVMATITTDVIGGLAVGSKSGDSVLRSDVSGVATMTTMNMVISAGILRVEFPPESHKIRAVGWCSAADAHPTVGSSSVDTEASRDRARANAADGDILDRQKTFPSIISLEHQLMQDVSAHSTNESEHSQYEGNGPGRTEHSHVGSDSGNRQHRSSYDTTRKGEDAAKLSLDGEKMGKAIACTDGTASPKKRYDVDSSTADSRAIHALRISSSSSLSVGNPNSGPRTNGEEDQDASSPMRQHHHHHEPSVLSTADEDNNGPGMNIYFDG